MAAATAATVGFAVPGCKQHGPPLPAKATGAKQGTSGSAQSASNAPLGHPRKLEGKAIQGRVIMAGKQWPIASIVGQNARMDLQVHCRVALEAAKKDAAKKGTKVTTPLCYRPGFAPKATTIRVDFDPDGDGAKATGSLRLNGEAAHFLIEKSGSTYQLLDLAIAPRRSDAYRDGEIRILSANEKTHKALLASLRDLLGHLPADIVRGPFPIPADAGPPKKKSTP